MAAPPLSHKSRSGAQRTTSKESKLHRCGLIGYTARVETLGQHVSPELVGFVLTLALSLLIGFEREELRSNRPVAFFGGVRTFPLIGLCGFLFVIGFPASPVPFATGLLVLGALLVVSHSASLGTSDMGITTEVAAVLTYALGAAIAFKLYWISIATAVVAVLILHEKQRLEGLVQRIPRDELGTLLRFLLLSGVILPAVPNHAFTTFQINPFKIWLVVVAVSGISYLSYLFRLKWGPEAGLIFAGLLGGAYSSTATTVALARQSKECTGVPIRFAGAILAATGVMYIRLWILLELFAHRLAQPLTALFWGLGLVAIAVGWLLTRVHRNHEAPEPEESRPRQTSNPLELTAALAFAAIFLAVMIVTRLVSKHFGNAGVLALAGIMGLTDVDPFILGLTQSAGHGVLLATAILAVVIASASNNIIKGIYAFSFGERRAGRLSLILLSLWGVASVLLFLVA